MQVCDAQVQNTSCNSVGRNVAAVNFFGRPGRNTAFGKGTGFRLRLAAESG